MEGEQVCGGSSDMTTALVQNDRLLCDSPWISPPTSVAATLHGASYEDLGGGVAMEAPFFQQLATEENCDEDLDLCHQSRGKKRRLSVSQVQALEKSFEVENKLEPERKVQLAKDLGLQPRQVAIWFQNRRARLKNKQLEKDYNSLKASYDRLKEDNDRLLEGNEKLKNEVRALKQKLDKGDGDLDNLEQVNAVKPPKAESEELTPKPSEIPSKNSRLTFLTPKLEGASSTKSDVFDSDSPHNSFLEPADSSHVFEPDQSDFSQDEEDNSISRSLLPPPFYPKHYHGPPSSSCNFEFPVEDQPFWSWTY